MDQQLTFDFPETRRSCYRVCFYKDDELMARTNPTSEAGAAVMRRSLVGLLQNSPRCFTTWEEDPRPTGWFGLNPQDGKTHIYLMTIEKES